MNKCPYYEVAVHDPKRLRRIVKVFGPLIKKLKPDGIAARGLSGIAAASALSYETGIPLIVVRKGWDKQHSSMPVQGPPDVNQYVIVDDMIATGATMQAIVAGVQKNWGESVKLKGIFLYCDGDDYKYGKKPEVLDSALFPTKIWKMTF
jgi:adenine/guanine phosphoribosyltransferase-like PRPP-binding protein